MNVANNILTNDSKATVSVLYCSFRSISIIIMFDSNDPFDAACMETGDRLITIVYERIHRSVVDEAYKINFNRIKQRFDMDNPVKMREEWKKQCDRAAIITWCRRYGSDEIITPVTFSVLIQDGLKHFKKNDIKVTKNDLIIGLGRYGDKMMHNVCIITCQMGFLADMNDHGEYEYDDLYS